MNARQQCVRMYMAVTPADEMLRPLICPLSHASTALIRQKSEFDSHAVIGSRGLTNHVEAARLANKGAGK